MRARRWRWLHGDAGFALVVVIVVTVAFAAFISIDPRYSWARLLQRADAGTVAPYVVTTPATGRRDDVPAPARSDASRTAPSTRASAPAGPGIHAVYVARTDGSFDVTERITQRGAGGSVVLTPPTPRGAGATFAATHARVTHLRLTTGAERVLTDPPSVLTRPVTLPILTGGRSTVLVLTYRLSGTTVHDEAWLRPLTVGTDPSLAASVRLDGRAAVDASSGPVVVTIAAGSS